MLPVAPRQRKWFFGCREEGHEHNDASRLVRDSLYAIACARPATIDFLALRTGWIVVLDEKDALVAMYDSSGREREPRSGSYLDRLRRRAAQGNVNR